MEEVLNKAKYKIPSEAADKAFAMTNLGDKFRLDFSEYRKFYENLLKKLETQGTKNAVTRDFRNKGEKMSRKISMSMKGAAIRAGYRQLQDGSFDRTLGKSWEEVLKKKKKKKSTVNQAGNYTKPAMRKRIFNRIKRGTKGGAAGQWSARKAQMLAQAYKRAGGGYRN
tara:strand:- start:387 stop:890 length:504 start_codon:yes stop_codon:yes gene_type:complete